MTISPNFSSSHWAGFSLQRAASLLGAMIFASVGYTAENPAGSLSGRVSDAVTGKSLQGAIVRVLGTSAATHTDVEGRYTLSGIPSGEHRLEIDYVGLDSQINAVVVPTGATTTANAALGSAVLQLESVTVSESARGAALAVNQQKTAAGIMNIVSEESFGSMINGNIGYALQRLPGLTVNEDEDGTPSGVNIRGLESKYNSFQLDGNRLPTSGNSRAFSTNQLTADGISNIEVIKAPTPDRDGDAIGGIINITSRSAFQREGRAIEFTGSGLYYDKNEKWGYNAAINYLDTFRVGGGEKNLGVSFSATSYRSARDYDNLDKDYILLTPANNPGLGLTQPTYFHTNGAPQTNFRDTKSRGFSGSLDFRANPRATFYLRPFYSHAQVEAEKARNRIYVNTDVTRIAEATYNTGRSTPSTLTEYRYQNDFSFTENDAYGLSFGGRHELDTIVFNYDAFYSKNESNKDRSLAYVIRNQGFSVAYDQSNRAEPVYTILNGKSPYDLSTINRGDLTINPRDAGETAKSVKADWEKKFSGSEISGSLKFGAKYRSTHKDQDQSSRVYRTGTVASGFPYADLLQRIDHTTQGIPLSLYPDLNKTEALLRSSPGLFALQSGDALLNDVINDYDVEEDTSAAYVMGTAKWRRSSLITGLRVERNAFRSETYRFSASTPNTPGRIQAKRDYTVWLPGVHLRHELRRNLILRESYNRSYSRPDVDRLVAGLNVDANTGNISGGNPNLKESISDNYDVQLEYYTKRSGLYSVGFFYKNIKGFYYDSSYRFSTVDANGYPIADPNGALTFRTPQNALGAKNYGVELIARQQLFFLPKPFSGFGVSLSATFTESDGKYPGRLSEKLPTYGFSDKIYYAALEYAAGKFRAQLSYRLRSDYLEGLDVDNTFDDWFGEYESVDWESSYQVTKQMKVFLNVNNLSDEPQISYQGFRHTDNPEDISSYGLRATFGATYKF
ncbi:MAG: TonB-dependent receptor [Opitutaceae bacterium]